MILDAIITGFLTFATATVNAFPNWTPPASFFTFFQFLGRAYATLNNYLPMDTVASAIALLMSFEVALLAFKLIGWIFNLITGRENPADALSNDSTIL